MHQTSSWFFFYEGTVIIYQSRGKEERYQFKTKNKNINKNMHKVWYLSMVEISQHMFNPGACTVFAPAQEPVTVFFSYRYLKISGALHNVKLFHVCYAHSPKCSHCCDLQLIFYDINDENPIISTYR